jgi:Concanavalin A-like lectin/glucanases superfamily
MALGPALAVLIAAWACAPAGAALTHRWPADGDALDVVGTANGTLNNGATFAAGLSGQGFLLDGSDDTITFGATAGNVGSGDFTIAFAIRTTLPTFNEAILTKRAVCDHDSFFDIHGGGSGTLSFEVDGDSSGTQHGGLGSLDAVDDGVFHTAVIMRQGTVLTWVVDGQPSGSADVGTAWNVSNAALLAAGTSPCVDGVTGNHFDGVLDDIRIADTADPGLISPPVPVNLTAPSIPAAANEGDTLACDPGGWRYHPSFGFRWLRDGTPIDGATASTYATVAADSGHAVTCSVTATNAGGSASQDSNAVVPVAPAAPPPPSPSPPPATTPPPVAQPPVLTIKATAVGLPSAKACVSGRRFAIHLRKVRGERVVAARVYVKGRRVRTVKGKRVTAAIDLTGLPKGRFVVRIVVTTVSGRRYAGRRTYHTCAGRKKAKKHIFAA